MGAMGISGNIALSAVDLFAAYRRSPSRKYVDGVESGVLYHVRLLIEPDLRTGHSDRGILVEWLDEHVQQIGRNLRIIVHDKNIVAFGLSYTPVVAACKAQVLFAP